MKQPLPPSSQADMLKKPSTLLGGLTPEQFMKRYWQKKPLLIRQAVPDVRPPVDRAALFELAGRDDVESRLIVHDDTRGWTLRQGPMPRSALPKLAQPRWTLLVQGLDLHVQAAHELLQRFRFVPDARLDDVMMSYASDGGGVGPHVDSYDVFLLQVHGRRHWRIGRQKDKRLQDGLPLKILKHFEPEQEWVLEPGDMLYLPPQWAHDGTAQGECMTCSMGFRSPERLGLAAELLQRMAEQAAQQMAEESAEPSAVKQGAATRQGSAPRFYQDPKQPPTSHPGLMPTDLQVFAKKAVEQALHDPQQLLTALGEVMTEPKAQVWFDGSGELQAGMGLMLDRRTRMMYDDHCIYANGESWRAAGADARLLRQLADERSLSAESLSKASDDVMALLDQWVQDGWAHAHK